MGELRESSVTIRLFRTADAADVSALIARTMRISNARDYPADRLEALIAYFTPDKLRALAGERHCLVALQVGRVVGTAARDGAELVTFFVDPDHQRHGLGTLLLDALEADAKAAGLGELRVDASLTGVGFYERLGYRRTGAVVTGTAGPHVPLTKRLRDAAG
jgi:GNAT superfamily N-acetyltransferase